MSETQTVVAETEPKTPEVYVVIRPKSVDELGKLKSFQRLTAKRVALVLHYIEHRDKLQAVKDVYGLRWRSRAAQGFILTFRTATLKKYSTTSQVRRLASESCSISYA